MTQEERKLPLIIVVDDDPEIRKMVSIHLKQMQCEVMEASDGLEGLDLIVAQKPDLVLLDVMMPSMNGWEVAKFIRELPDYDDVGIIMVTAIGETVNEMTSSLYGADEHINKPFQLAELSFKIRKILSQKRREKNLRPEHSEEEEEQTVQSLS